MARNNMPEDAIQRWFENGNGRGRFEKNDLKALWVEIGKANRPLPDMLNYDAKIQNSGTN